MSDDEWRLPVPREDPEARKARLVRDDEGGARLVPQGDIVEGAMDDRAKDEPGCPFSGA
ncbi:MAG TPA: hypothetical protein VFR28_04455 [Allosphingosinicella sp.]|nr:hypothetical protein [Allosphingosinicella sp.]